MRATSIIKALLTAVILFLPGALTARGLGELNNVPDSMTVTLTHDLTVLAQSNSGVYVTDDTGYGIIRFDNYSQAPKYSYGDVIPNGFKAMKITHDDEPMLVSPEGLQDVIETGHTVPIEDITCSQLNHNHWAHLVVIRNAKIHRLFYGSGTITDSYGGVCILDNEYGITLPDDDELHDCYGIVASVPHVPNTNWYEFWPVSVDVPPHTGTDVASINELRDLREGVIATFMTPLTAVWQHDQYLLVKDIYGYYGIVIGEVDGHFTNGDLITNAQACWQIEYNNYYGPCGDYLMPIPSTFVPSGHGTPVEPPYMTVKQFNHRPSWPWVDYVGFKDVKIRDITDIIYDYRGYTLDDGTESVYFTNYFDIPFDVVTEQSLDDYIGFFNEYSFDDLERFVWMLAKGKCEKQGQLYDIEGCSTWYHDFAPTKVTPTQTYKYHIGDLDGDGETTIADVELLRIFIRNWMYGDR